MFTIKPQRHISEIAKTDLIIIPSSDPHHHEAVPGDDEFIEWGKRISGGKDEIP